MGYTTALDLATHTDLRQAVSIHFAGNCYPPIPQLWLDQAIVAIYDCASGDYQNEVDLPEGVQRADGSTTTTAGFIVNSLRLDAFVDALYEGDE